MRRREFITGAGAVAAWPIAGQTQPRLPVIGYLGTFSSSDRNVSAFRKGLAETGYVEGRNVSIEYRSTEGRNDPMAALPFAKELVDRRVSIIVATTLPLAIAAKEVTQTIPIVFRAGTDPVAAGLVASLNRPGANVTGIYTFGQDLGPKRLELLRELLPVNASVAVLVSQTNVTAAAEANEVQAAARALGVRLVIMNVTRLTDVETSFAGITQSDVKGLLIINAPAFFAQQVHLAALVARTTLPAIYGSRIFAEAGGLMTYAADVPDGFYRTGAYTGRILKGEKPANLPAQQSTKVELVINMKTAKTLGITFPLNILGRADEVIE